LPINDIPNFPYLHTCKHTWQRRRRQGRLLEEEDVEEDFEIGYFEEEDYAELEKVVCTLEEMNKFTSTDEYVQFRAASYHVMGFQDLNVTRHSFKIFVQTQEVSSLGSTLRNFVKPKLISEQTL
jgi:hypothetical protein